jgi:holo-[acyl-carrier protein] synthase
MTYPEGLDIVGIGIDATDIPRLRQALDRFGERFLKRVFTEAEIAYCRRRRDPVPHLAGRFAAKEAGMKALGTGHSHGVLWKDVEIIRGGGPPQLRFHNAAARHAERLGTIRTLVTITHAETLAFAQVMLIGRGQK